MSALAAILKAPPLRRFISHSEDHRSDWLSPLCILVLGIIGVVFIHSAQSYTGGGSWRMQMLWLCIGWTAYALVAAVNYKIFLQYAHLFYWAGVLLLVPLAVQALLNDFRLGVRIPLVETRFGATRWLNLGVASVQPSELAKIGTLMMVASLLARSEVGSVKESIKVLLKVGFAFFIPVLLIFAQPDLGSSLVFPPMVFALLYISRLSEKFFLTVFSIFILGVVFVGLDIYRYQHFLQEHGMTPLEGAGSYEGRSFIPLRDYQRNRILAFVAPEVVDPQGNGVAWNLNQSLIAVAGGGLLGKGLNEGTQAKLGYLPPTVAPNDFIFSVLAEESGFLGGMVVIALFLMLVVNGFRIASLARDRFGKLLAAGVSIIFLVHITVNIGMTIGLMPITGLPLPFLSYGGSFVLSCCILQGLVQSVYRYRKDFS